MLDNGEIWKTINAGKMTWFEADRATIYEILLPYVLKPDGFVYLRKGEVEGVVVAPDLVEEIKIAINWGFSVGRGEQEILGMAAAYGREVLEFAQTVMDGLLRLDFETWVEFYMKIVLADRIIQLTENRIISFMETLRKMWPPPRDRDERGQPGVDGRFLCTGNRENKDFLAKWKSNGMQVRFYEEAEDAGFHRLFLNGKGYAFFCQLEEGERAHMYGFEGTESRVVDRLKDIFEEEWKRAILPPNLLP